MDRTVNAPRTRKASWRPLIISLDVAGFLGMNSAVVSPAAATPKLIDICCMVLAMELALLALSSGMSA